MDFENKTNNWLRAIAAGLLVLAVSILIVVALSACAPSGPTEPQLSPKDLWISAHPTHSDEQGLCREFDGELCDEDPYDLDDLWELDGTKKSSAKPVPKASVKPKTSPKPASTRRR
jgi:hypothetical protein